MQFSVCLACSFVKEKKSALYLYCFVVSRSVLAHPGLPHFIALLDSKRDGRAACSGLLVPCADTTCVDATCVEGRVADPPW
jgi:hypothetical protein